MSYQKVNEHINVVAELCSNMTKALQNLEEEKMQLEKTNKSLRTENEKLHQCVMKVLEVNNHLRQSLGQTIGELKAQKNYLDTINEEKKEKELNCTI